MADREELAIGDVVLDRYRVVQAIASGGHSQVYLGHDERLARAVCIKILAGHDPESGIGKTSRDHFIQEAFALSKLSHPSTLRIYDFGTLTRDGRELPIQVSEYMNDGTLSDMVRRRGALPVAEAVAIISSLCDALCEAHELGIIHRDIKPQNILFTKVGATAFAKLADFGIAKWRNDAQQALDEAHRAEETHIVAGKKLAMYSPSWAAPEQFVGTPVTNATDTYSLAAVFFYLVTGIVIFNKDEAMAGYQQRRASHQTLQEALAASSVKLDAALMAAIDKGIAFDPNARFQHANELAASLRDAHSHAASGQVATPPAASHAAQSFTGNHAQLAPMTAAAPAAAAAPVATPAASSPAMPSVPTPSAVPTPSGYALAGGPGPAPSPVTPAAPNFAPLAPPANLRPPIALHPVEEQRFGDRLVRIVHAPSSTTDISWELGGETQRLRLTIMRTNKRLLHVKGLTCFVAPVGGRPASAMSIEYDSDIALIRANSMAIGTMRVRFGVDTHGGAMALLADQPVFFDQAWCRDPICVDFGAGSVAYFVYTIGAPLPKPPRRM